jgi:hypothetical protein
MRAEKVAQRDIEHLLVCSQAQFDLLVRSQDANLHIGVCRTQVLGRGHNSGLAEGPHIFQAAG